MHLSVQIDQRFGRGVVISPDVRTLRPNGMTYRCARLICDCGSGYTSRLDHLLDGGTLSCGCLRNPMEDLAGQRFGKLVAIQREGYYRTPSAKRNYGSRWLCRCDCGTRENCQLVCVEGWQCW